MPVAVNCKLVREGRNANLGGSADSIATGVNYLLAEGAILEVLENALSEFISRSVKELVMEGRVWLGRFNARANHLGQDAFYIEFSPSAQARARVGYVLVVIAEGRYLTREIKFRYNGADLPYVDEIILPFLEGLFRKFGFTILEEHILFGLLEEKAKNPKNRE